MLPRGFNSNTYTGNRLRTQAQKKGLRAQLSTFVKEPERALTFGPEGVSISALSYNLITDLLQQQQQNPLQQMRKDFSQLASALQSGDLSTAQSAYSKIQQLMQQNGSASSTGSTPANTVQNDFAALGQALQSGDIGQAQTAFSQMQKDFQASRQASITAPAAEDQYVPGTSQQQALSVTQQVRQDYAQLSSSLQSGDLTGAQSAFASLQQALQSQGTIAEATPVGGPPIPSTPTNSSDSITTDFNALGSALSSGNLTQAQSAFSQLQKDIQTTQQAAGLQLQNPPGLGAIMPGHHHHHHGGGGSNNQISTSTTASPSSSTTGNARLIVSLYA